MQVARLITLLKLCDPDEEVALTLVDEAQDRLFQADVSLVRNDQGLLTIVPEYLVYEVGDPIPPEEG